MAKLTAKAERFCREYLVDYNPQRAAERAGYAPGDAARGNAGRLLKDGRVVRRIEEISQSMMPDMGRKFLLNRLYMVIVDPGTPANVVVTAVEKAAKVQHLYEVEEVSRGEVHVHLESRVTPEDEPPADKHPAESLAQLTEESK